MKLEVHERLALLAILPKKGDYAALKTIRRAREMISFSPEDMELYKIKNGKDASGNPQVQWDTKAAAQNVKDVPVDEYTTNVVRNALAEMNNKGELTEDYMSLYEKFVVIYQ